MGTATPYFPTTKTVIALMKQKTVNEHGMHYEISNDQLHPFEHLEADVTVWLQSVLTKDKPAVGVCDNGPLKSLLKSLDIPFVDISEFDPKQHCIGTPSVLPPCQGLPLCRDHYYENDDIGFEDCARVRACQMSWWLRRQICYSPSLEQVNGQRVIWQTRCDRLMGMLLCEHCMNEKDKAYEEGEGLQWNPNCDGSCRRVAYILRDRLHVKPDYADEKVVFVDVKRGWQRHLTLSFVFITDNVDHFYRSAERNQCRCTSLVCQT